MKAFIHVVSVFFIVIASATIHHRAEAHCQIPCGIYDDHNRVHQIREDITTIQKSVTLINELATKKDAQSQHQLVRWVMNKEKHAENIIRTISDYFMTQKIVPTSLGDKKYLEQLARHHAVMVAAMKCKQSSDMKTVQALIAAVDNIEGDWPKK